MIGDERGIEPIEFEMRAGMRAEAVESGKTFDVAFNEGDDFCDFDDETSQPVGIYNPKGSVERG